MPNISYFHTFGFKCFVHNNGKEALGKFDTKSNEGIFLGYSLISKAYRVFNKRLEKVEESIHVIFYETNHITSKVIDDDDDVGVESKFKNLNLNGKDDEVNEQSKDLPKEWRYAKGHPKELIIGDPTKGVVTRSTLNFKLCFHFQDSSQECE